MKLSKLFAAICFAVLCYTAIDKILYHDSFQRQLSQLPAFTGFADVVSWLIPIAALVGCLLLYFTHTRFNGLLASFLLMAIFTLYVLINLNFAKQLPCSCAGILSLSWKEKLLCNLMFMLVALAGLLLHARKVRYIL